MQTRVTRRSKHRGISRLPEAFAAGRHGITRLQRGLSAWNDGSAAPPDSMPRCSSWVRWRSCDAGVRRLRLLGWSSGEDEAVDAGEVGRCGGVQVAEFRAAGGDGGALIMADFEGDEGVGIEMRQGVCKVAFDDAKAVGAAVEGERRITFDLGAEGWDLTAGDVGEVGDDEIEAAGDFFEEVAAQELDVGAEARGVEARKVEGVFADVGEDDFAQGPGFGEAETDAAGAGGHVEHACRWCGELFEDKFDECFGFRTRNEGAVVADELVTAEFDGAEEMLKRLPFPTAAEEFAQGGQTGLGDGFIEAEVEIEPTAAEDVGEEVLHVEPGFLDLSFLQVGGARADDFENELHGE